MQRAAFSIDDKPLRIRDALAHGRLVAPTKEYPLTLWKFGREVSGRIPIEFNEVLTSDWLEKAWKMINQQKDRVDACSNDRPVLRNVSMPGGLGGQHQAGHPDSPPEQHRSRNFLA
jgi:hypothetical protein